LLSEKENKNSEERQKPEPGHMKSVVNFTTRLFLLNARELNREEKKYAHTK